MLLQPEQIQSVPVSMYSGNVQFFNQDVVTFCNSTTKTLLGRFRFDTSMGQPRINRVGVVSGFGQWQASSATASDKLFFYVYLTKSNGTTVVLIDKTISRSQSDFATGHFRFELNVDVLTTELLTLDLDYADTKAPFIETYEATGFDLRTCTITVEVYGQMALSINPVVSNTGITSPVNLVQNPGFEVFNPENGFASWIREPAKKTDAKPYPHTGDLACSIYSGETQYNVDQENNVSPYEDPKGFIRQASLFQSGKTYLLEFWSKNRDKVHYATDQSVNINEIIVPIENQQFNDDTQNISILGVYAYNSSTGDKTPITTVKTTKDYAKTSMVVTGVPGYDGLYFEMSPSTFRSSVVRMSQARLYRDAITYLKANGLFPLDDSPSIGYDVAYSVLLAMTYSMYANIMLDDVRVSEITPTGITPFNGNNKEIRLRNFTVQYIS